MTRRQRDLMRLACNAGPLWPMAVLDQLGLLPAVGACERRGLLVVRRRVVRLLPPPTAAVYRYEPNDAVPYGLPQGLSAFAKKRFEHAPPVEVTLVKPTERAYRLFGEDARSKGQISALAHDAHLAATYALFALTRGNEGSWHYEPIPDEGEGVKGIKRPDAMLVGRDGRPRLFTEVVGGSYTPARLLDLMSRAEDVGIPIEFFQGALWV